jgi:23S rRNA pseudouridine2605 synthase
MTYKKTNRRDDDKRRGAEGAGNRERKQHGSDRPASGDERGARNRDRKPYSSDRPVRKSYHTDRPAREDERGAGNRDRKPYSSDKPVRKSYHSDRPARGDERGAGNRDRKPYSSDKPVRKSYHSDRPAREDERGAGNRDRKPYSSDKPKRKSSTSRTPAAKPGPFDKFNIDKMREAKAESLEKKERKRPTIRRDAEKGRPNANSKDLRGAERAESKKRGAVNREPRVEKRTEKISDKVTEAKGFERRRTEPDELIRLNRFIANSGVCSRRKADELIEKGEVTVNGEVIRELGFKVKYSDKIKFEGKLLKPGKLVYVLLNKPKDFITTTDDPMERRTVLDLTSKITNERIFPVGRLDRNTTGLLLLTNDGDLADKLSHPRNQVRKVYEVELDKSLVAKDFEKVRDGLELEDGFAKVDQISYLDGKSKKFVGVEIHIGRNRIVRRIFESLGYEVVRLDRVIYAGLTKKDLSRGRCRMLSKEELIYLKHLNKY